METADVIVIGSGQGGIPFAVDYAKAGRKVVLFERDAIGSSCLNYGCTPSKAFLAAAHYFVGWAAIRALEVSSRLSESRHCPQTISDLVI